VHSAPDACPDAVGGPIPWDKDGDFAVFRPSLRALVQASRDAEGAAAFYAAHPQHHGVRAVVRDDADAPTDAIRVRLVVETAGAEGAEGAEGEAGGAGGAAGGTAALWAAPTAYIDVFTLERRGDAVLHPWWTFAHSNCARCKTRESDARRWLETPAEWVLPPRRCPWRGVEDRAWCPANTTAWLRHYYGDDLRAPWRWRAWSALKERSSETSKPYF